MCGKSSDIQSRFLRLIVAVGYFATLLDVVTEGFLVRFPFDADSTWQVGIGPSDERLVVRPVLHRQNLLVGGSVGRLEILQTILV